MTASVNGPSFRFEQRIAVVADLHLDAMRQLGAAQLRGRGVAIHGVVAIDRRRVVVLLGAKPFGKADGIEVLGVDVADRVGPAVMGVEVLAYVLVSTGTSRT